ncbi:MAG: hypothetical protein IJ198_10870 [Lachnospiraceae bacterium]|nr:hypothetical protein [Lachnospiraceae bacterium]MBQ8401626.1 hypothetical protein [Clostridia bacterium]
MAKNEDGKSKLTVTLDVSGMSSTAAIVEQDVEIPMRDGTILRADFSARCWQLIFYSGRRPSYMIASSP